MSYETCNPAGAKALLEGSEEWIYIDVRTVEEFEQSHPSGAYNVPIFERDDLGRVTPNDTFGAVVQRHFPTGSKLVLGCAAGVRSARACEQLVDLGYRHLVNMHGGFQGASDPYGTLTEPGWQACGYACAAVSEQGRSYVELSREL